MPPNSIRFDLSDHLIHFFREVNSDNANCPTLPQNWDAESLVEDTRLSPFFMLRCAIRQTLLWATWSFRNNRRTIYGPHPAICFTEMPLAAFLESSEQRAARGEAMSQYALMFPKSAMFALGARPVIYGLSDQPTLPTGDGGGARLIEEAILPLREQYRYVTYSPASSRAIDWTHEREWRWPYRGEMPDFPEWGPDASGDIPGLDLNSTYCRGLGAVVKSRHQAELLTADILTLVDKGRNGRNHFAHILILEDLPELGILREPAAVGHAIMHALLTLEPYFQATQQACETMLETVNGFVAAIEGEAPEPHAGEIGRCWLCLNDNRHPLARALVALEEITITQSGRYLYFPVGFDDSRNLRERENMTLLLAERILNEFGLSCTYYSVSGSDDPEAVPYYVGDVLGERPSYNYAHHEEDF